jgi:iron only hydrogenase large subunit-like protein
VVTRPSLSGVDNIMTKKELKKLLREKGIKFKSDMKVEELRSLLFSFEDQNSDHIIDFNEEVNIESNESERDRETVEKGGEEKGEDIIHQEPIEAFASIHREDKINKYYLNISGSSQAIHIFTFPYQYQVIKQNTL